MVTTETMQLHSAGEEPKPRFDYRGRHRYVITLDTFDAKPLFTNPETVRSVLGALRDEGLAHHFEVLIYSFLPSTLTLLVRGKEEGAHMKSFLAAFRASSSAATPPDVTPRLWKRTYRERVLRKTEELRNVIRDVAMMPVRAGLASNPLAYEFQGSFVDELRSLLPAPPQRPDARPSSKPGGFKRPNGKFGPKPAGFKSGGGGFRPKPSGFPSGSRESKTDPRPPKHTNRPPRRGRPGKF